MKNGFLQLVVLVFHDALGTELIIAKPLHIPREQSLGVGTCADGDASLYRTHSWRRLFSSTDNFSHLDPDKVGMDRVGNICGRD